MKKYLFTTSGLITCLILTGCGQVYTPPTSGPTATLSSPSYFKLQHSIQKNPYTCEGAQYESLSQRTKNNVPVTIPANQYVTIHTKDMVSVNCPTMFSFIPKPNQHYFLNRTMRRSSKDQNTIICSYHIYKKSGSKLIPVPIIKRQYQSYGEVTAQYRCTDYALQKKMRADIAKNK